MQIWPRQAQGARRPSKSSEVSMKRSAEGLLTRFIYFPSRAAMRTAVSAYEYYSAHFVKSHARAWMSIPKTSSRIISRNAQQLVNKTWSTVHLYVGVTCLLSRLNNTFAFSATAMTSEIRVFVQIQLSITRSSDSDFCKLRCIHTAITRWPGCCRKI